MSRRVDGVWPEALAAVENRSNACAPPHLAVPGPSSRAARRARPRTLPQNQRCVKFMARNRESTQLV
jgi:hypothetical protein